MEKVRNEVSNIDSLDGLATNLVKIAGGLDNSSNFKSFERLRPWKCPEVQELLEIRRRSDIYQQKEISKRMQREVWKQNRVYMNETIVTILKDFKELRNSQ